MSRRDRPPDARGGNGQHRPRLITATSLTKDCHDLQAAAKGAEAMIVKVSVTAEDIASGKPGEICLCPIYLALQRAMPDGVEALWVDCYRARLSGSPWLTTASAPLPQSARDFIGRFDNAIPVEPFEFDLDVPDGLVAA